VLPKRTAVTAYLDGATLAVECGRSAFTLPTAELKDYPASPKPPVEAGTVDAELFADAVAQLAPAALHDDSLPLLSCVTLRPDRELLTMWATDRYQLGVRRLPWTVVKLSKQVGDLQIPSRTLLDAAKGLAAHTEGAVHLHLPTGKDHLLGLAADGLQLTMRLMEGTGIDGPKFQAGVEETLTSRYRLAGAALTEAVRRVSLVAPKKDDGINLSLADGTATISAGGGQEARAVDVIDAVLLEGEPRDLLVNPHRLLNAVGATGTDEIDIDISGAADTNKPLLVHAAAPDDHSLRYVLMPMRPPGR
jgi:DNA polymerase-3 subunit beta